MLTVPALTLPALNLNAMLLHNGSDARTRLELGRVSFLNARFVIEVTTADGVQIRPIEKEARFLALGLPADPDGPLFDFVGFATLLLHDGTQLTVHTAARHGAAEPTRPDGVQIVSGSYGVAVQGLGADAGALRFVETLHEQPARAEPPGAWQPLDPEGADPAQLAPFGALLGPRGHALLDGEGGVQSITFMGSFQGAPAYYLADPDDTSGTGGEQRRLRDQDNTEWRLCLTRQGGQVRAWIGTAAAGVDPSWGTPAAAPPWSQA